MDKKRVKELAGISDTKLVSAFPGCGKSYFFKNNKELNTLDSDSSGFDKRNFPDNYIKHIKENIGKADIIFISSHKEVRDALVDNGLKFTLIYPNKSIKKEFIQRYIDRGNEDSFVKLLEENWDNWLGELKDQDGCDHITLSSGEFISDKLDY